MKKSVVWLMVAVALMWTASAATAGKTKDSGKTKAQSKVIESENLFDVDYLLALPRKEWPMVPEKIMCVTMTCYTPPTPLKQNTGDAFDEYMTRFLSMQTEPLIRLRRPLTESA